ncbi:MAG TPA: hypothetical protein VKE92_08610 [Anaerolineales bacterium]|nr:hypothetical protein [Anaerolineales bacterium]
MSRIGQGKDVRTENLVAAVKQVISQVDSCPADDCGSNLIRDILIPAYRDYEIGTPKPQIK